MRLRFVAAAAVLLLPGTDLVSADPQGTPVVVELFTSQGCSSCPPADRLLSRLGNDGAPHGGEVISLSFHVDYWNYIGWTDPFSSRDWSDRQRRYAEVMRLDTIYTPQIVVQGAAQIVGSNAASVLGEIARARSANAAVAVELARPTVSGATLEAALTARIVGAIPDGLELLVALFEERLVTPVGSGENAAKTLKNDFVVRVLRRAFDIEGRRGESRSGSLAFELDPAWKAANLGVAAFAQDPATLRIYGAARRQVGDL